MVLKVAPAPLHWSQPSIPHSSSSSQTLASSISSPSSKRRSFSSGDSGALFCRYVDKSALFPNAHRSPKLCSLSHQNKNSRARTIRRALSASMDSFSDEEFSKKIQSLASRFQTSHDEHDSDGSSITNNDCVELCSENEDGAVSNSGPKFLEKNRKTPFDDSVEPPDEIIPANIEMKANSFDIPLSLRIIKRKKQWQAEITEARDTACCSVKKAFSSMVFIIRELHCYTLQMREILFYEDLQGILANVQKEMHASFVWLFQKVFSQTPTLMMYLMILLANYSVHSMSAHAALAATMPSVQTEQVSLAGDHDDSPSKQKFDSPIIKNLRISSPSSSSYGKTASIGGNNGGGGKYKPVGSDMDGEGRFNEFNYGGVTSFSTDNPSSMSGRASAEEEEALWGSIVNEALRMEAGSREEALDRETMLVAPVIARIETDDQMEYLKTDMFYQTELAREPENVLLLVNYAQFLYLVAQDFDRAEEYFKRATKVEPKDAEALNKYANFLWVVRNDLWAAEETYLEAISAEPNNAYYASNYANFLWSTGGEDTCFPLSSPDSIDDV
ncbi:tetratricopeptide repeat protein [Striga asiatica]|uniref:Tetratricopeptide repeat protein n=1 Tax=Striga asiatica TaxID=4170 RepID=A0A5A7P5W5_STRAF|nr:tetratricopeptide repeat protein [Striga asiatica]